jgi:hypothetical protein
MLPIARRLFRKRWRASSLSCSYRHPPTPDHVGSPGSEIAATSPVYHHNLGIILYAEAESWPSSRGDLYITAFRNPAPLQAEHPILMR